ncbi:MAG: ribbon-helix-helix domain-containing protein [Candidatus Aminicenantes bacterium]|nr:ribbon-helix-helix domain-containing protein [Candidatus Aminicenantes bacterium]
MAGTVKFSISLSEGEYKALESARRKAGRTRSQFIREALEARGAASAGGAKAGQIGGRAVRGGGWTGLNEERGPYGSPLLSEIIDSEELRRRAIAAAGRFDSGVPDLSIEHDKYLTDSEVDDRFETKRAGRAAKDGEKS